jgi:folate-dependent phosphoribosylglycinamide formyltransferase PurN
VKTLDLTVLVHEGPIARTYLATMRHMGLRPARIVVMVSGWNSGFHRILKATGLRRASERLAISYQRRRNNFWVSEIAARHPSLFATMREETASGLDFPAGLVDELVSLPELTAYADRVETIAADSLRDPALHAYLETLAPGAILYTGGGIVPREMLRIPGLSFLHVHPAELPRQRGADGILWSVLLGDTVGGSCLFLDPGIDTGDIVAVTAFPIPRFRLRMERRPDDATLYRALFAYFDPFVRASVLRRVLIEHPDPATLPRHAQREEEGRAYRFLNPSLRRFGLERIFVDG